MPNSTSHTSIRLPQAMRSCVAKTLVVVLLPLLILNLLSNQVFAETTDTHSQWECRAGADGSWDCGEKIMPGKAFPRPKHSQYLDDELPPAEIAPAIMLAKSLDWVDEEALAASDVAASAVAESLTTAGVDKIKPGCCGAYVEPPREYPGADLDPNKADLRITSTSTEVFPDNIAHLNGDVHLTQGYRQVHSDKAIVNQNLRTVDLEGNVQFREPGVLLTGETAHANMDTNAIQVNNSTYLFHESGVRGTADQLDRPSGDVFYVNNATYTTCEPNSNTWQLVASKLKIDPGTGIANAKHVRLKVKDIPILYLPWVRFPIDDRRASGLLFPQLSLSEDNGFEYAQPIYLNLAPNYDATITPRYIQERGSMAEVELRHLSKSTYTVLSGAFLSHDDGGDDNDKVPDPITGKRAYEGEDRWLANIDHTGNFGRHLNTRIDYTRVSDDDYFRDLDNATLEVSSQTHLMQLGYATYNTDNWFFRVMGRQYQTIADNIENNNQYKLLPRIDANADYRFGDFEVELTNQFSSFGHNNDSDPTPVNSTSFITDNKGTYITGNRIRLDYSTTWDNQWAWGYFRPSAKVKHISYKLDNSLLGKNTENPSVTVPVAVIDTGIYLERDTTWLSGYTQTFEPRLYMVYSKYEDQSDLPDFDTTLLTFSYSQLFRDDRFVGGDRIGDTKQASVGFTTRLIDQKTGVERLRASLGQIFYLDDRYVALNTALTKSVLDSLNSPKDLTDPEQRELADGLLRDKSAYAAELSLRLWEKVRFTADLLYDDDNSQIDRGSASVRYHGSNNQIFNLGYRFTSRNPLTRTVDGNTVEVDADIEQADFSTIFPIARNWSLVGRYNYDITNNRNLESLVGLQYDSCCWRFSLLARKWIDRDDGIVLPEDDLTEDKGIFLQIQFKGLAGYGSKANSIMKDSIYGYEPPAN